MGRFNSLLDTFVSTTVLKCDLAAVIQENEWNDEIHPTRKGFEDAARVFYDTLKRQLPAKFP